MILILDCVVGNTLTGVSFFIPSLISLFLCG